MATISSLPAANSIDAVNDYLAIDTASLSTTQKINRNTLLSLASAPVGLTDSQTLTNKTLTSPTISGPTFSGTLVGTYTIGGTPTFPSSVATLTGSQTLANKTLTSPTINSPTITNATISADTLSGYTTSNSGTVYGISVTTGTIGSAALATNAVTNSAIASGALYASKVYNPYKFSAYSNGAQTPTGNAWTLVNVDTIVFDTGSNFNTSTHKFTAPVSGFYQINAAVGIGTTTDGQLLSVGLNKNTFVSAPGYQGTTLANGTTQQACIGISHIFQLTANDTIGLYVYCNSALIVGNSPTYTFLEGFLVSAT